MSAHKIEKKIVKYRVVKPGDEAKAKAEAKAEAKREALAADAREDAKVIRMHEKLERPARPTR